MKNPCRSKLLLFALLVAFLCRAEAQPEIRYPNPAYLHWEEPCIEKYGLNPTAGYTHGSLEYNRDSCIVFPFRCEEDDKLTLYGVAVSIAVTIPEVRELIPLDIVKETELDILLYEFTEGDSNVRLIRRQHYVLDSGKRADVILDYKYLNYYTHSAEWRANHDSLLHVPMYEFYFDSPVSLSGNYLVGVHFYSHEHPSVFVGTMYIRRGVLDVTDRPCCHSGFWGIVDMQRNVLKYYRYSCGDMCKRACTRGGALHAALAPSLDTVSIELGQGILPIIKPQGYLSAIRAGGEEGDVRLMPNPANRMVTVMSSYVIEKLEVYDEKGARVLEQKEQGRMTSVSLDVSKWTKGTYVVLVHTPAGTTSKRLVVN
ncbi:MAG: T9SS type A sorting domain-containing protein [Bacteroidales bacterium]|nr:T9SS type A sorting domain-containing protein [Bacteroidales bacterium]